MWRGPFIPTMKRILDRSFRYVPSHATDIRKTFERIRREQEAQPPASAVISLKQKKTA
jgi:hypothetical protein